MLKKYCHRVSDLGVAAAEPGVVAQPDVVVIIPANSNGESWLELVRSG